MALTQPLRKISSRNPFAEDFRGVTEDIVSSNKCVLPMLWPLLYGTSLSTERPRFAIPSLPRTSVCLKRSPCASVLMCQSICLLGVAWPSDAQIVILLFHRLSTALSQITCRLRMTYALRFGASSPRMSQDLEINWTNTHEKCIWSQKVMPFVAR